MVSIAWLINDRWRTTEIAAPRERCKQIEGARIEWETCEENKWQVVAGMVGVAGIALAYKAEQRQLDQRQKLGRK